MYAFKVPDIGEGVVEAEILAWRVGEGDWVEEDQILVDLMTDKAEIEIPSPCAGRVERLHWEVGDIAPVGAVLIEVDDEASEGRPSAPAERAPEPPREQPASPQPPAEARPARPPLQPERPHSAQRATQRGAGREPDVVPAVRELARRLGVDLAEVRGTGPQGRIMRRDVERHHGGGTLGREAPQLRARAPDPEDWERQPLRGLRRAIARRMVLARRTAAHFSYVEEVDMTRLLECTRELGLDLSPLAFIARAAVRALEAHPTLNASIDEERGEIVLKAKVHLGVATATDQGLLVPVVRDAAVLSVAELASAIATLAERARAGGLRPEELSGSTFTISSLGKLGGIASTPIVNYPEVAILGVNRIRELPVFVDGELVPRRLMNLSLSVDHRIADGLVAAEFIRDMRAILEPAEFTELEKEETP